MSPSRQAVDSIHTLCPSKLHIMASADAVTNTPLLDELHAATRKEHAKLNRNIISRLPLCLPHSTSTSILYCQGMTVIGQIYYGFEKAWDSLLEGQDLSQRQRHILEHINISRLRRTGRLRRDLRRLRQKAGRSRDTHFAHLHTAVLHFQDDVREAVLARPHLILAYTWTMYLALFNGGRWIAKQLLSAGSLFWNHQHREAVVKDTLSFWFFSDDEIDDGTDLKVTFKQNFAAIAATLTEQEREEIVAESRNIFGMFAEMVVFLDRIVGSESGATTIPTKSSTPSSSSPAEVGDSSMNTSKQGHLAPWWMLYSVTSLYRFIMNTIPLPRSTLFTAATPLVQNIEQEHG